MPAVTTPDAILQQLAWRYATKKFDPSKKIDARTWSQLEQTLVLAPSSFGLQLWRYVVVNDPALRQKLRAASWNQTQITDASHMVVFCARTSATPQDVERYIDHIAKVRSAPHSALDGYKQMMLGYIQNPPPGFDLRAWMDRQTYIAMGFLLMSCALLGIDACPMEGIDKGQYDEILALTKDGYHAIAVVTAGYRAADDPAAAFAKVRFPAEQVVKHI